MADDKNKTYLDKGSGNGFSEGSDALSASDFLPFPGLPVMKGVSGKYTAPSFFKSIPRKIPLPFSKNIPKEFSSLLESEEITPDTDKFDDAEMADDRPSNFLHPFIRREVFYLDVDGPDAQMAASGTLYQGLTQRVHWIANLRKLSRNIWYGDIWHKDGDLGLLRQTHLWIYATAGYFSYQRKMNVTFTGGGVSSRKCSYKFNSSYFRRVEFEYDYETGVVPVLEVDSGAHNNRPPAMAVDPNLTIEKIFKRAGIDARRSTGSNVIPSDGPDANQTWSDAEMHDAMQVYWSKFANRPQWALWVLMAKRHDMGPSLGGIMFDDIGPNHRQGTAIFNDSFIANPPPGEAQPADWIKRMKLWTAVHEMGHAFNLAHSWQKHLGNPWINLPSEPEARSFMNYPFRVAGGEQAFFADFEYGFSNMELLFLRHAPERFVQMGNADWFDDHGFENLSNEEHGRPEFTLKVSHNHPTAKFEFLEQVVLDISLTNVTGEPKLIPQNILTDTDNMTIILKKTGKAARQFMPFATRLESPEARVLQAGETMTESVFVSAGRNGWDIAEPGSYSVQVSTEIAGRDLVSNIYWMQIETPHNREGERLAQDVFTEDAGRVMAFDGSMYLAQGNEAWRQIVEKMPKSRAAVHAQKALTMPLTRNYSLLRVDAPDDADLLNRDGVFHISSRQEKDVTKNLNPILFEQSGIAAETLGGKGFERFCRGYAHMLHECGDDDTAEKVDQKMLSTLSALKQSSLYTSKAK